ncbi:hypothetical protein EYF80_065653 [Liparis tanakae]|uniref:Uncharacterized protein n=1 Tax=Liparis tanakae TaxID=230148 RepID=A0A4Z2E6E9_9TELE|nr:hypothetical protein EYF80_065653 [Liparis tanakae]
MAPALPTRRGLHRGHAVLGAREAGAPRRSPGWTALTLVPTTALNNHGMLEGGERRDLLLLQVGGSFQGAERGGALQQTKQRSH